MSLQDMAGTVNEDLMRAEKERQDRKGGDTPEMQNPFFLSTPGNYTIRILPPHKDQKEQTWLRKVLQYYVSLGPKQGVSVTVTGDGLDPVTRAKEALIASDNPESIEKAQRLSLSARYFVNALVISAPAGVEFEVGKVYTLKIGEMIKRQLIELDQEKTLGWEGIYRLEDGVNVTISRSGAGLDTRYNVSPHGSGRSNILNYLTENRIDLNTVALHNLDEAGPIRSDEEVEDILRRGGYVQAAPPVATPTTMEEPEVDVPAPPTLPSA